MLPRTMLFQAALLLCVVNVAHADGEFQYFSNSEINYWKKPMGTLPPDPIPSTDPKPRSAFPWKKYLDPKNDDFFKEGDYTPPAPFMEIARNPSDENIANWFHYLELKNALTHRLQERLEAYASAHGGESLSPAAERSRPDPSPALDPDAKRFRLRLYFDSKCPHCQHMLGTLAELSSQGFWIELRQIDGDLSVRSHIPFPVMSATHRELEQYHIESVPLLLVGDLKRGTFIKLQGYQPTASVLQAIRSEMSQPIGGRS